MKVFLTGNMGYVGNVLASILIKKKYEVTGCDIGYYPQNFIEKKISGINLIKKDIRDLTKKDLEGHDAVLHLAALSNDPLGEFNPSLTNEINFLATIRLGKLAKEVGVERFVFSSSCSLYGVNKDTVNENSPLSPLTAYAKSKVIAESELLRLQDESFCPVILRSATAYGISPSLRLDLVVNNLVCAAITTGFVKLLSDGTAWRPLIHVEDMANAFIQILKSPYDKVSGEIFNVGTNEDNFTVKQIAEFVSEVVTDSKIEYAKNASKDSRSYRVSFDKIQNQLGFKTKWKLKKGITNIYEIFKAKKLTEKDFNDEKFYRVHYLKWLLKNGTLDSNLRIN